MSEGANRDQGGCAGGGKRLPRHKIPAAFEFLSELPHGPTGKIDKRRLQ